jgi:hypothetical protein
VSCAMNLWWLAARFPQYRRHTFHAAYKNSQESTCPLALIAICIPVGEGFNLKLENLLARHMKAFVRPHLLTGEFPARPGV